MEAWKDAVEHARTVKEEAEESRPAWREAHETFQRLCSTSVEALDSTLAFHADFRVFLQAKDRFLPGILEDYYVLDRRLLQLSLRRIKTATLPRPRVEESLREIGRGRVRVKEKR
jgi:hypothetical protein